jgi:single-stranded DNA-binding protein
MNDLNSILIEGAVSTDPYKMKQKDQTCYFMIENRRYYGKNINNPNKLFEDKCYIPVVVNGKLAESVYAHAKIGRNVRIVGYLTEGMFYKSDNQKYHTLYIIAEHAELKMQIVKE